MKKLYILSLALTSGFTFAQTPIITGMLDGDCTGGNPKAIEIYADGTVDFSQYSIENQTNANTTWGNTLSLESFGTVTDDYIYVVNADDNTVFYTEFADIPQSHVLYTTSGSGEPQPLNINGDDRVRIIVTADMTVVDQYGEEGVDGTDTAWEHLDSWAYRVNGTEAAGANFDATDWTFGGVSALDGEGLCQDGAAFSTLVPFGTYSPEETTATQNFNIKGLKLFPNPLNGNILNVTSAANAEKTVAIYDIVGKQVINTVTTGTVNASSLNAGVYIVKITENGKTATRKLVVK
ncbi:T9SS type A sorting domain-containing protein [Flavobacterium rhizosphaerae]|uniref:T9SS type A sorting domain-containing protein n=1 Tax=Flavobacterium rhizosphaerae TaxID=3163298 RepID=A0ABW8YYV6_9FLAO